MAEHLRFVDAQPTLWSRGAGRVRNLGIDEALRGGGGDEAWKTEVGTLGVYLSE